MTLLPVCGSVMEYIYRSVVDTVGAVAYVPCRCVCPRKRGYRAHPVNRRCTCIPHRWLLVPLCRWPVLAPVGTAVSEATKAAWTAGADVVTAVLEAEKAGCAKVGELYAQHAEAHGG